MKAFTTLTSIAAPLPGADINTDIIVPARFLLLPEKKGLGDHLFHDKRQHAREAGTPFVLDTPPYDRAEILVTGPNFGCGSSREQAVWALADFGIRCVIGTSFGEIFYANCFKNGVLPIVLPENEHVAIVGAAGAGMLVSVDLVARKLAFGDTTIEFEIAPDRRAALVEGLDEIGTILRQDLADIERFEAHQRRERPWLYLGADKLATFADLAVEVA